MLKIDMIPFFEGISQTCKEDLDGCFRWKSYRQNQEIINREDDNSDMFFVQKGRVRVIIYTVSGREVTLDDITEGGFFGEIAAIDKEPRSASVMAVEPSEVAFLSAKNFEEALQKEPLIAMRIMKRMANIIRQSNQRIVELSTLGANNRVYAEILRIAVNAGVERDGQIFIAPIPVHNDIAARVGTARETVARAMNVLARKNIVTREKTALVVHDIEKLSDIVLEA